MPPKKLKKPLTQRKITNFQLREANHQPNLSTAESSEPEQADDIDDNSDRPQKQTEKRDFQHHWLQQHIGCDMTRLKTKCFAIYARPLRQRMPLPMGQTILELQPSPGISLTEITREP